MTSGVFQSIPISSITIDRGNRQRRDLPKIDELAASIRDTGLINPIVVTPEFVLVAGERRLTACAALGWTSIPAQLTTDLDSTALTIIELEENLKRVDLSWQDQVRALETLHQLKSTLNEGWTQGKTAALVGFSEAQISSYLSVAKELKSPEVAGAEKFSVAANLVARKNDRAKKDVKLELIAPLSPEEPDEVTELPPGPVRRTSILNEDFLAWSEADQTKFNFIHCDFPYGVNISKGGQEKATYHGTYSDSPDVYFALLNAFLVNQDNFIASSAHCLFWFSMDYYTKTVEAFTMFGWFVSPFPLIWLKSDNAGILPDSNRQPRRIYETAMFLTRGDRKIVRAVANAVALPTTKIFHMSEKPTAVLEHFFRMLVDESTLFLDPTCGGGNALKVAESSGAQLILGIEKDTEFASRAMENNELSHTVQKLKEPY